MTFIGIADARPNRDRLMNGFTTNPDRDESAWRRVGDTRACPGFTLVELMMAMAVSSILLVMLASMLESSLNAYTGQQRRSSASVESRAGLEILRADLRSYCAMPDDPESTGDDLAPRFLHVASETELGSDRIAFLRRSRMAGASIVSSAADQGSLVLVAYAVGYTPDAGGRSSQKLYRRQYTTEETYVKLRDHLQLGSSLISNEEWKLLANPSSVATNAAAAGATAVVSVSEPIVFQVIQFKVKPLVALLAEANDPQSLNGVASLAENALWPVEQRPAAVDILLRVTNRSTAAKLDSEADWRGEGKFQTMLLGRPVTPENYEDDPEVETQQLRIHLPRF